VHQTTVCRVNGESRLNHPQPGKNGCTKLYEDANVRSGKAAYIEVVTDRYSMSPRAEVMFELTRPKFDQDITWERWITEFRKGNNITAPK
jgi:hypothetical protein